MKRALAALLTLVVVHTATAQSTARLDDHALETLRVAAEAAHSDAVLVLQDGEPVAEWYFGEEPRPIELMSVLKSVVALGIGRLLTLGKIDALDQPVHAFYTVWLQGAGMDPVFRREYGDIVAYYGDGYLGQTLMVVPEHGIVAVRQVQRGSDYEPAGSGTSRIWCYGS